ncbi:phage holin family protein [Riemerella columbipharyngis]|uniref:Putative membrane protein n=1 Tax=Riemerella columbipharyngis TaxID=1071918 RepID=A0A1G6YKP5_9FLAO|nr:phage holin family protein [Riemerella columbipharyngis]SDD90205.1 putative membrane protein [Riemerella columbipharyngis]
MIIRLLVSSVVAFLLQRLLPGVHIASIWTAALFIIVLGVLNAVVKPFLDFIGLPLTILTLGLFSLVINTIIIVLAGYLISGVQFDSFWYAMLFGVILSFVTSLFVSQK